MNILFMGPPGAGKGTQAEQITIQFGIPHISTGDTFRQAMKMSTPLGKQARTFVDRGLLVPDEVTNGIVRDRLAEEDCLNGFLLDGFPRTIAQAEALDVILAGMGRRIDHVINLNVGREFLLTRLSGRRICKTCGLTYHIRFNPPRQIGICDFDGGVLVQRSDDTEEKVGTRLDEYSAKTAPLLQYYKDKGYLYNVNGEQEIEAVTAQISAILKGKLI